jgi:hypothetical protein
MPLLPGCVRESADGSGATSDVYTDTLLSSCFYFLPLAWRPGKDQCLVNASQMLSELMGVKIASSPTPTFTSFVSWDMWYLLGIQWDSPSAIFFTVDANCGQSSETDQQASSHIQRLVFLSPITSPTCLLLMTGSDGGCRGIDHFQFFNAHHSILACRQFNKLVLIKHPPNDLELLPPFPTSLFSSFHFSSRVSYLLHKRSPLLCPFRIKLFTFFSSDPVVTIIPRYATHKRPVNESRWSGVASRFEARSCFVYLDGESIFRGKFHLPSF